MDWSHGPTRDLDNPPATLFEAITDVASLSLEQGRAIEKGDQVAAAKAFRETLLAVHEAMGLAVANGYRDTGNRARRATCAPDPHR